MFDEQMAAQHAQRKLMYQAAMLVVFIMIYLLEKWITGRPTAFRGRRNGRGIQNQIDTIMNYLVQGTL